jgi:hypothetical protein
MACIHFDAQKFRGLYRSKFILQTFAVHLDAIKGSIDIPGLFKANNSEPECALALSAAAVSFWILLLDKLTALSRLSVHCHCGPRVLSPSTRYKMLRWKIRAIAFVR